MTVTTSTATDARSRAAFAEAQELIPGGVNSPVRAFRGVGGTPRFIARAGGAYVHDADGNAMIDYVLSYGPLVMGHAHPHVVAAITEQAAKGTSYGAPTELETELARRVVKAMPSVEMVRFVNSGTEATMSVLRLARAATRRDKIIKFEGGYHGHADFLLSKAGSGVATLGLPDSPGVPSGVVSDTLTAPYNDLDAVAALFAGNPDQIAAIIVEPVAGNMGCVPPAPGYLEGLRSLCDDGGALLVFDEVMSGWRCDPHGAQGLYGVRPDLTALGKVIGGGLPVGAYGGRRDLMSLVAPLGPMYQAGTLSGNPLAMAAGIATLDAFDAPGVWAHLDAMSGMLCDGLAERAAAAGLPWFGTRVGTMFCGFFTDTPVTDYATAKTSDVATFRRYFHAMLEHGVYLAPSQFEAGFMSYAHGEREIAATLDAAEEAFAVAARG